MPLRDWLRSLIRRKSGEGDSPGHPRPANRGPGSGPPIRRTGLGLMLLAIGRREGLEEFGNTAEAYLASLAPLLAFALVSCVRAAAADHIKTAVQLFLMLVCSWLAPAVISHPMARVWGRNAFWPRYVNILNWTWMLMFLVAALAFALAKALVTAGLPPKPVMHVTALALVFYGIWFHWFVARGTLELSRWRTVLLLVAVAVGTNLIVSVPLAATGSGLPAFVLP